ncbi:hypothetical protein [Caenispirillum bisanense]|uniref:hypothetical protein n=1 Tax=Caenispirillum bisanense TaxID=414052 RepID=UPI001142A8D4|nr:hypothetical protein [Caenispirillum bisanense]
MTVDLEPHGDRDLARTIAEVEIVNVTASRLRSSQDYAWRVREVKTSVLAMGWLVDWRREDGPMTLVAAVLDEWQSGRLLPFDNHGHPRPPEGMELSTEELWRRHDEEREEDA